MKLLQLLEAITEKPSEEEVKAALASWWRKYGESVKKKVEKARHNAQSWSTYSLGDLPKLKVGKLSLDNWGSDASSDVLKLNFQTPGRGNAVWIKAKLHLDGTLVSADIVLSRRKTSDKASPVWNQEYHDRDVGGYDVSRKAKITLDDEVEKLTNILENTRDALSNYSSVAFGKHPEDHSKSAIYTLAKIPAQKYRDKLEPVLMKFNVKWLKMIILDSEESFDSGESAALKRWLDYCSHYGYSYDGYKTIITSLRKLAHAHLEKDYSKDLPRSDQE